MTDITELAQSLKAAAENATPGEWCSDDQYGIVADAGLNGNYYIASCSGPEHRQNKRFIALANPANVIALVEALEKAQQQMTESENRVRKQNRHICELFDDNTALRQRIAELEENHAQVIQSRDHYKRISEEGLKQLAESSTVTVKLPDEVDVLLNHLEEILPPEIFQRIDVHKWNAVSRLSATGIKWEAE